MFSAFADSISAEPTASIAKIASRGGGLLTLVSVFSYVLTRTPDAETCVAPTQVRKATPRHTMLCTPTPRR